MSYFALVIIFSVITTSSCLSPSAPKLQFYRSNFSRSSFHSKSKHLTSRPLRFYFKDSSKIDFALQSTCDYFSNRCTGDKKRYSSPSAFNALSSSVDDQPRKDKNKLTVSVAVAGLIISSILLVLNSGPGSWRYYLAGGICAAISHGITTPVDVIKTRKQVDENMKDMNMLQATLEIVRKDKNGALALLAGLGPTAYGYLFEGAIKFGIYEVLKPYTRAFLVWCSRLLCLPCINSKILGFVISGAIAGFAASVMLCPMEALRIRLVAEPTFAENGWVECGLTMVSNEGVKGLWKSFPAMLCKQVPYTVTKNVSFDMITTMAYATIASWGWAISRQTKFMIPLVSAMVASILSCISSQPGDMLLSVVSAHEGEKKVADFYKDIINDGGIRGLFVGIQERFVHVGLIVTVQLFIYDFVKRLCGIPATGL